jgi:hypothetical protein
MHVQVAVLEDEHAHQSEKREACEAATHPDGASELLIRICGEVPVAADVDELASSNGGLDGATRGSAPQQVSASEEFGSHAG